MDAVIIRPATLPDSKKLSVLFKVVYIQTYGLEGVSDEFANFITSQFSTERLERIIRDDPDALLVAEYKDNLVGVLEIHYDKPSPVGELTAPELNKIYILDWFCGKGIGEQLVREAEKLIRERGYKQLWLWFLKSNQRAHNFYLKHGFRLLGEAPFEMEENTYMNFVMAKAL